MALTTVQSVLDAWNRGDGQRLIFSKTMPSTTVARIPHTVWTSTGTPIAGTNPSTSNTAVTCNYSTVGSFQYNTTASTVYAQSMGVQSPSSVGTLILCDRLVHTNISIAAVGSTNFTSFDGTARLASGEGGLIWTEVTSALSAASNTITLSYTNQSGTSGKSSVFTTTASAVVGRSCNGNLWQPLSTTDNDIGVRSIQSYTITGTATGNINIALINPILYMPVFQTATYYERDFVVEMMLPHKISDQACLFFIFVPVSAATVTLAGELRLVEG